MQYIARARLLLFLVYVFLVYALFATSPAFAAGPTIVPGGGLNVNTTWSADNSPYIVMSALTVNDGVTLTIEAGTVVQFQVGSHSLNVANGGSLIVNGSAEEPVIFTSDAATPAPGEWRGLWVQEGGRAFLQQCDIGFTGRDNWSAIYVDSTTTTLENCRIHHSTAHGVELRNAGLAPTLHNLEIDHNGGTAIYQTTPDMTPDFANLNIHDNDRNAIASPGGSLSRAYTLHPAGSVAGGSLPFLFLSALTVNDGVTLTIEAGTVVQFQVGSHSLNVANGGSLIVNGSAEEPVIFTSDAATPAPGEWRGLWVHGQGRAFLQHCDIGFTGHNSWAAVYIDSPQSGLAHCSIHHTAANGVIVRSGAQPTFYQISFEAIGALAVENTLPSIPVKVRQSWWGHYRGPFHPVLNPLGRGHGVSDGVLFEPWLLGDGSESSELRDLDTVEPAQVGNSGLATVEILGVGFYLTPTVQLVAPDGAILAVLRQDTSSNFRLLAKFDLAGRPTGKYDVRVVWANGIQKSLEDALEVVEGEGGNAWVKLEGPSAVRTGRPFRFTLTYGNDGDSDILAPWLTLQVSPGLQWQFVEGPLAPGGTVGEVVATQPLAAPFTSPHIDLLGISPDGDASVLRPGQSASFVFSATWTSPAPSPFMRVWLATPEQMLSPEQVILMAGYDPNAAPWSNVVTALTPRFGAGFEVYRRELANEAMIAGDYGFSTPFVHELLEQALYRAAADSITTALSPVFTANHQSGPDAVSADRPLCIEEHDRYATDFSTYGSGSRLLDGRWVPWPNGEWLPPDSLDMANYRTQAFLFGNLTNLYFWSSVVKEWSDHFQAGSGTPWHGTYEHPISAAASEMIEQIPLLKTEIENTIDAAVRANIAANEPPEGILTVRLETAVVEELHFANYTIPEVGNALWNLGQTSLALGRSPTGNNIGYEVELFRPANSFEVTYRAREVPARIEDIFQIWEEKVNAACKLQATGNRCPGYKRDIKLLFEWAYMLDLFDTARCFDWYINLTVRYVEGKVLIAGVEANAGGDQTIMLGEGQEEVTVSLNGSARYSLATAMGAGDPKAPFVWSGIPDPVDAQNASVNLRAGTYVFVLEANAKGRLAYAGRDFSDLDSVTVTVLPHDPDDEEEPRPVTSWDPNDKTAPAGIAGSNVVLPASTLPYLIRFENDAKQATAPAQIVEITDILDAGFDLSSFEFTGFGFGPHFITLPPGLKNFETEIDLTPFGVDLYVAVEGTLDPATRQVKWLFTSLDPDTRQLTDDALAGFLPPNDETHRGEGFVTFNVRPKADLALGSSVPNTASIVFDTNPAIVTNTATVIVGTADFVRYYNYIPTIQK
jgi:hypothetical protein